MTLDLTEDEKLTLLALPKLTIEDDPHPLSPPRVRLRAKSRTTYGVKALTYPPR